MEASGIALRFLLFVDLLLLVGIAGHAGYRSPAAGLRWVFRALAAIGAVLSIAGLVLLAAGMTGTGIADVDRATLGLVVTATAAGRAWMVRMVALGTVAVLAVRPRFAAVARPRARPPHAG